MTHDELSRSLPLKQHEFERFCKDQSGIFGPVDVRKNKHGDYKLATTRTMFYIWCGGWVMGKAYAI